MPEGALQGLRSQNGYCSRAVARAKVLDPMIIRAEPQPENRLGDLIDEETSIAPSLRNPS
jgi:hypothetical protein